MLRKALFVVLVSVIVYMFIREKKKYNADDVKGLNVVITGSSTGIGEQIAYQLAAMGAKLMVTARTESKLKQVVEKCKKLGSPEAHYVAVSMYSYDNASLVIKEAVEKLGGIDFLILNHHGQFDISGYSYDIHQVETLLVSNALTHAHMATVSMEHLKKNNGRIVVTSTVAGIMGSPFFIPHITAKLALNGFFKSLRQELKYNNTDVSVTIAYPGFIGTENAEHLKKHVNGDPASPEECAAEIIRGGMTRESQVYYPGPLAWVPVAYSLFPDILEKQVRKTITFG